MKGGRREEVNFWSKKNDEVMFWSMKVYFILGKIRRLGCDREELGDVSGELDRS